MNPQAHPRPWHARVSVCPSDLRLEAHLMGLVDLRRHLRRCSRCLARVAQMHREHEDFMAFVYPATVEAILGAAAPHGGEGGAEGGPGCFRELPLLASEGCGRDSLADRLSTARR